MPTLCIIVRHGCWRLVAQVFDQNVTLVDVESDAAVRSLLVFRPPLPVGALTSGVWADNSTLVVTFHNVPGSADAGSTAVGVWSVSVLASGGLLSAVGQSAPSNSSIVVTQGTW
jgi:hypothetical protein